MKKFRTITIPFGILIGCFNSNINYADIPVVPIDGTAPSRIELDQGWSQEIRQKFWFTSQGARILPYTWFMWLEQANSTELFRSVNHMDTLRYLPIESSTANPAGLPIGFVMDKNKKNAEPWVGLTCSACHTNQINYQGVQMLIEGAPTLANFVKFFSELIIAMDQTDQDESKFERFAKKVLADNYTKASAEELHTQLTQVTFNLSQRQLVNALPSDYPSDFTSYARLDAFGNIQNAGSAFALHDTDNKNFPTAPVSYPFLWGTHQSNVVQWNGSAPNTPIIGPLIRNMGEVVGVFGSLNMEKASWWDRLFGKKIDYSSTINMHNLGLLEKWVKQLRSPQWQQTPLPPVDPVKAAAGSIVYQEHCASCHQVIPHSEEGKEYKATLTPLNEVGTDTATAVNATDHLSKSLFLEGTKKMILLGDKFSEITASIDIPANGVVGLVLKDPVKALEAGLIPELGDKNKLNKRSLEDLVKENMKKRLAMSQSKKSGKLATQQPDLSSLVYKARPLNGIWATAPYFHNGSVPNLWEVMTKEEDRVTEFWVGSREFDPVNVGFDTSKGMSQFHVYKLGTKTIQLGNSNRGHTYGTELSDDQKWAVIEYMKKL